VRVICDYSLQAVKSRPAVVGERLKTQNFGSGTRGFAPVDDGTTAVCLLPGTEVAFDAPVRYCSCSEQDQQAATALFRQINKDNRFQHHDALEFPDGQQVLLTTLIEGQTATVLQLPAAPKTEQEAKEQERLAIVA